MTLIKRINPEIHGFSHLIDELFKNGLHQINQGGSTWIPATNIKESDKGYVLELALPGFKKDDFKVAVNNGMLSVSSEVKNENENKNEEEGYVRREFSYQSFTRQFTLPEEKVDTENIAAKYEDGVLRLSIPKKNSQVEADRLIEIS